MKTSNKLILSLFATTVLAIVGSNMVLKAEYEKIDFEDPFYRYTTQSLSSFNAIKLQGNAALIHVKPGENFEIRVYEGEEENIAWEINDDTLVISLEGSEHYRTYQDIINYPPVAFIMAPSFRALHSTGIDCILTGWQEGNLVIREGNGEMLLKDNAFEKLTINISKGGLLKIAAENQIQQANIEVMDTSTLVVENDVFQSFEINVDEQAHVKLPGGLLSKLLQD